MSFYKNFKAFSWFWYFTRAQKNLEITPFYHQTFTSRCFYLKIQPNNCVPIYFPKEVISCLCSTYQAVRSISLGELDYMQKVTEKIPQQLVTLQKPFSYLPDLTYVYHKRSELLTDRTLILYNFKGGGEGKGGERNYLLTAQTSLSAYPFPEQLDESDWKSTFLWRSEKLPSSQRIFQYFWYDPLFFH